MIASCLNYLKDFLDSKREIYEPLISAKTGEKSILMLAYYRNNLTHVLINEAEIACSLLGFSLDKDSNQGSSIESLWRKTQFLKNVLSDEFVVRDTMRSQEDFVKIIGFMESRDFLKVNNGMVKVDSQNEKQSLG